MFHVKHVVDIKSETCYNKITEHKISLKLVCGNTVLPNYMDYIQLSRRYEHVYLKCMWKSTQNMHFFI